LLSFFADHYIIQFLYINLFWILASSAIKIYDIYRVTRFERIFTSLFKCFALHNLFIVAFIVISGKQVHNTNLYAAKYLTFIGLILLWRLSFLYSLKFFRSRGLNSKNVIIIGTGKVAEDIFNFFKKHPEHGYKFLGFFDDEPKENNPLNEHLKGGIKDSKQFVFDNKIDEIYCALPNVTSKQIYDLTEFADKNLIRLKVLPDFSGFRYKNITFNFYDDIPVLTLRKEPLENSLNKIAKRIFDIIFSTAILLVVFPVIFPIIALLIKLTSKGPVFFKQYRSGKDNEKFICYKFRSMHVNGDSDEKQASRNDQRITRVGKILRKTNLDELPQFYNVLMGHMSVVGPRPHMLKHTEEYSQIINKFMVRHFVKPGITGFAQVKGYRGETNKPALMEKRVQHDVWYIENWSFFLDLKIISQTAFNMIKGQKNAF